MPRPVGSVAVALLLVFAGCGGVGGLAPETKTTDTTVADPSVTESETTQTTTYSQQRYLDVVPLSEARAMNQSASERVEFENLRENKQSEFEAALTERPYPSAWEWGPATYVHYNDSWYSVQVVVA